MNQAFLRLFHTWEAMKEREIFRRKGEKEHPEKSTFLVTATLESRSNHMLFLSYP